MTTPAESRTLVLALSGLCILACNRSPGEKLGDGAARKTVVTCPDTVINCGETPSVTLYNQPVYTNQPVRQLGGFTTAHAGGAEIESASFTINDGQPINVTPSYPEGWVGADVALFEGVNTIQLQATDSYGNTTTATQTVTVDTVAPAVTIHSPLAGQPLGTTEVSVNVEVQEQTPAHVTVQDAYTTELPGSGTFSPTVSVVDNGSTTLWVTATDAAGNSTTTSVDVRVDSY